MSAPLRELDSVRKQIRDNLVEATSIAINQDILRRQIDLEIDRLVARGKATAQSGFLDHDRKHNHFHIHGNLAGAHSADI